MRRLRFDKVDDVSLMNAAIMLVTSQPEPWPSLVLCSHIDYFLAHYGAPCATFELKPDLEELFRPRPDYDTNPIRGHRFNIFPDRDIERGWVSLPPE